MTPHARCFWRVACPTVGCVGWGADLRTLCRSPQRLDTTFQVLGIDAVVAKKQLTGSPETPTLMCKSRDDDSGSECETSSTVRCGDDSPKRADRDRAPWRASRRRFSNVAEYIFGHHGSVVRAVYRLTNTPTAPHLQPTN